MNFFTCLSGPKETGVWILGIILLLCATAYTVPANYHTAGDLMVYRVAQTAIEGGGNPYNQSDLQRAQFASTGLDTPPGPIWNPPIFFVTMGPLLHLPPSIISIVLPLLSLFAGIVLCWTGWRLSGAAGALPGVLALGGLAIFLPWWTNILYGQWSIVQAALLGVALLGFVSRRDLVAGTLMSAVAIKPHPYWLLLLVAGVIAVRERRWVFLLSAALTFSALSLLAEIMFPGIHWLWIHRESWPTRYVAATFPSFLRMLWKMGFGPPSTLIYLGIVATSLSIGLALYALIVRRSGAIRDQALVVLSLAASVLFAPYGFVFDEGILILLQTFLLATATKAGGEIFAGVLRTIIGINLLTILIFLENPWGLWLEWCLLPILFVVFQLSAPKNWVQVDVFDR